MFRTFRPPCPATAQDGAGPGAGGDPRRDGMVDLSVSAPNRRHKDVVETIIFRCRTVDQALVRHEAIRDN